MPAGYTLSESNEEKTSNPKKIIKNSIQALTSWSEAFIQIARYEEIREQMLECTFGEPAPQGHSDTLRCSQ